MLQLQKLRDYDVKFKDSNPQIQSHWKLIKVDIGQSKRNTRCSFYGITKEPMCFIAGKSLPLRQVDPRSLVTHFHKLLSATQKQSDRPTKFILLGATSLFLLALLQQGYRSYRQHCGTRPIHNHYLWCNRDINVSPTEEIEMCGCNNASQFDFTSKYHWQWQQRMSFTSFSITY